MTGVIVMTVLTVLCAVGVLAAVIVGQRPEEGWRAWFRSSLHGWRREELLPEDVDEDDEVFGGLGTLYLMSEPGSAYTRPEELTGGFARPRALRQPAGVQVELPTPAAPAKPA